LKDIFCLGIIFNKDGAHLFINAHANVGCPIYSQLLNPSLTYDWAALSIMLENKNDINTKLKESHDILLEINKTITTAQLILLDGICVQKKNSDATIKIKEESI
jgi:hypothetical protein